MMKGGKTKVMVTHVPRLLPLASIHPCVAFPHYSYPCTMACGLEPSPTTPLRSTIILHDTCYLTDVPWTCHALRG